MESEIWHTENYYYIMFPKETYKKYLYYNSDKEFTLSPKYCATFFSENSIKNDRKLKDYLYDKDYILVVPDKIRTELQTY